MALGGLAGAAGEDADTVATVATVATTQTSPDMTSVPVLAMTTAGSPPDSCPPSTMPSMVRRWVPGQIDGTRPFQLESSDVSNDQGERLGLFRHHLQLPFTCTGPLPRPTLDVSVVRDETVQAAQDACPAVRLYLQATAEEAHRQFECWDSHAASTGRRRTCRTSRDREPGRRGRAHCQRASAASRTRNCRVVPTSNRDRLPTME